MVDTAVPDCVKYAFVVIICSIWAAWIICCVFGCLWVFDLIKYEDYECIHLDEAIPIALISISGFNGLLLLLSLLVFYMKIESIYKPLICLISLTSLAQIGLHLTLFIYISDLYWFKSCYFDEETINTAYYYLFSGVIILFLLSLLSGVSCIYGVIMQYFGSEIEDTANEMDQLIQRHDSRATIRSERDEGFKMNPFHGSLDWEDYKAVYHRDELNEMISKNEYQPMSYDAYFILIQIHKHKANALHQYHYDDEELIGNKLSFKVTLNDNEDIQTGYAIYDDANDTIMGIHRIVFPTFNDLQNLKKIKYKIANEAQQIIGINHQQNEITINEYTVSWQSNAEINNYKDIKKAKVCTFKNVTLYLEQIRVYSSMRFPAKEQCKRFFTLPSADPECKQRDLELDPNDMSILFENERNMQIYYNPYNNMVYGIKNDTADISATHCGFGTIHSRNEHQKYFDGYEYYPYYFENITQPFFMCCRYHFMKDQVLLGQDAQFNIFKSLCFLSSIRDHKYQQLWARLSVAILVMLLQGFLTWGVVVEVIKNWDIEEMFDDDRVIITISFIVFAYMSYQYWFTVVKFFKFYETMHYISVVDWIIPILDFTSNIVIGAIIVFFSFTYLLLAHSIQAVVWNSFAVQFIVELDDMANLFEADEDFLLEQDWYNCVNDVSSRHCKPWTDIETSYDRDWDQLLMKRRINLNVPNLIWKVVVSVVLSPLFFLWSLIKIMDGIYYQVKIRNNTMNWTKNSRTQIN